MYCTGKKISIYLELAHHPGIANLQDRHAYLQGGDGYLYCASLSPGPFRETAKIFNVYNTVT